MSEDTLTPRNEIIHGLVELVALNVGDEFQAGDTGGTVVWKVNKGSAKAVDVLYDGHSKPISIAPNLKVTVRKKVDVLEEFKHRFAANVEAAGLEPIVFEEIGIPPYVELVMQEEFEAVPEAAAVLVDVGRGTSKESFEDEYQEHVQRMMNTLEPVEPPATEDLPPAPKPVPSPTIRVIRLTADGPKTMPVMVQPPLPTCKFDLTLTPAQIRLLVFDSVKQMFYKGLSFGWTRETFFEVAKAKFPHLKAGQNYESCLAQIRLYHCALKNAGRMQ